MIKILSVCHGSISKSPVKSMALRNRKSRYHYYTIKKLDTTVKSD